jgi:hypothetical protein
MRNAELAKQVTHLSQVLTQQQALLAESSRIKFFHLSPPAEAGVSATNAIPSPELQRALFLAMARELGWLQLPATTQPGLTQTNLGGVDFVDLQPGTNTMSAPINLQSLMETEPASTPESPMLASDSGNAIPGFVSSTNVVLAFEPSTSTPTGSALNFWTHDSSQSFQLLGSTVLANNPRVVTFSTGVPNPVGMNFTLTPGNVPGSFNVIGQSFPTNSTP